LEKGKLVSLFSSEKAKNIRETKIATDEIKNLIKKKGRLTDKSI